MFSCADEELQEFNCTLGVKPPLTLLQISAPDFHCGHEVHYQEDAYRCSAQYFPEFFLLTTSKDYYIEAR